MYNIFNRQGSVLPASDYLDLKSTKQFFAKRKNLFSRSAQKIAAEIIAKAKESYNAAVLDAHADHEKIQQVTRLAKQSIRRQLIRNVPNASKIIALNKQAAINHKNAFRRQYKAATAADIDAAIGNNVAFPGLADYDQFEAPFELAELNDPDRDLFLDHYTDDFINFNVSFINPATGIVGIDFNFLEVNDSILMAPVRRYYAYVSTGINYTIPKTGYLTVSAVANNIYNGVAMLMRENLGFSSGWMNFTHRVGILLVRSGEYSQFSRVMIYEPLQWNGKDVKYYTPEFPSGVPYILNASPDVGFLKGEKIQIRFFSSVYFYSFADDMANNIYTRLAWQLKRLYVRII